MHQDVFEIETESNKVTAWSTNKIPLPFHCHVVTFPPISEIPENKQALHYHNVFEIHYVVEGTLHSTVNQVDYQTKQGDILVICPNDVHANHFVDKKTVTFRIMIDNDYLISLGLSFEGLMIQPQIIGDQTLSGYMNAMYLDSIQEGMNNYLNSYAVSLQLMVALRRHYAQPLFHSVKEPDEKLKMIKSAIKYMENHYAENFTFQTLAKSLGYSQCYFSRTFSEIMGVPATKYLQKIRCSNAQTLLRTGAYTVSEAGELCGFSSPSYFIKTYKSIMGRLPKSDKNT